jgi:hypothetical protein
MISDVGARIERGVAVVIFEDTWTRLACSDVLSM